MNRFAWDLRYEPPTKLPGVIYDEGRPRGALALPGAYRVKLSVAAKSWTAPLEIKLDPRVTTSRADLEKQFELMTKLRDRQSQMNDAILQIRDLRTQLQALRKRLARDLAAKSVLASTEELDKKMTPIEEEMIQVKTKASEDELNYPTKLNSKLAYLQGAVDSADTAPTQACYELFEELNKQLGGHLARWSEIVAKDLPALNELMRKENIPQVGVAPPGNTH